MTSSEAIFIEKPSAYAHPEPPVVLSPLCGMVHGLLQSVEPADSCLIATFRCKTRDVQVALPCCLDLPIGQRIGICRDEERYLVRRLA